VTVPLSKRTDAQLLAVVWVLTLAVLGIGIAATAVVLLVWGGIGLVGAAVGTVIYVRGRRRAPSVPPTAPTAPPTAQRSAGEHPEGPA
jgi:hypothetical protein